MKIEFKHFSMKYRETETEFLVKFTDCNFKRDNTFVHVVSHLGHDLIFRSYNYPEYRSEESSFFIPGSDRGRDGMEVSVPKGEFSYILSILNKADKIDKPSFQISLMERKPKNYFTNGTSYTCKEQCISGFLYCKGETIHISEVFTDAQLTWLKEIQSKLPEPFDIERLSDKVLKLTFSKWWRDAYRIGWALLACRVANGREKFTPTLEKYFKDFQEGNHTVDLSCWSYNRNWHYNSISPTAFLATK